MKMTSKKSAKEPAWQEVQPSEGNRDKAINKANESMVKEGEKSREISSASSQRTGSEKRSKKGSEEEKSVDSATSRGTQESGPLTRQELINLYKKIKEDAAIGTVYDDSQRVVKKSFQERKEKKVPGSWKVKFELSGFPEDELYEEKLMEFATTLEREVFWERHEYSRLREQVENRLRKIDEKITKTPVLHSKKDMRVKIAKQIFAKMRGQSLPQDKIILEGKRSGSCKHWFQDPHFSTKNSLDEVKDEVLENAKISFCMLYLEAGRNFSVFPREETLLKFEEERFLQDLLEGRVQPDTIFQWLDILAEKTIQKKSVAMGERGTRASVPSISQPGEGRSVSTTARKVVVTGGARVASPAEKNKRGRGIKRDFICLKSKARF